ncbi:hypothetical protein EV356DRAFT_529536 [Viridothelium virens]|uniref:Uncharacterized protein n=1 Tax=Viridothelium virens TaxID=1048519 RepID=A0A6A6HJJ1_VIRVR|nr:hypothetical protein EV356DRAFT_529536 [Viridothelium virens]
MAPRKSGTPRKRGPLKNLTIAATGDFGSDKPHDKIKQWVEYNGGTFSSTVDTHTTHLIASKDHWKKRLPMVRKAIHKGDWINIVNFDWLEDTTQGGRKRAESNYSWKKAEQMKKKDLLEKRRKKEHLKREGRKAVVEQFHKGCKSAIEDINSDNHHVYQDSTGFDYDITLARLDVENNRNERYQLKLYESHTIPNTYAIFVKFSRPHRKPINQLLIPQGASFDVAFSRFQDFFRKKCKKHWSQRLEPSVKLKPTTLNSNDSVVVDEEEVKETPEDIETRRIYGELAKNPETKIINVRAFKEKEAKRMAEMEHPFVYVRPKPGRPLGVFPPDRGPDGAMPKEMDVTEVREDDARMRLG